ncbi:MAG: hypothetical protein LBH26_04475 [Treponema sp.]|nr:hypothetical protein [Treponema sp.]
MKPWNLPLLLLFLSFLPPPLGAQQGSGPPEAEPYLIPRTVYVGDRARLVVRLGSGFAGTAPFTLEDPAGLPAREDIRIHRLELDSGGGDREGGGSGTPRLLVDFTPYSPGLIEFPPLPLPGGAGIEGLRVNVASVLGEGKEALVLSEPAPPLAVPGTILLIWLTVPGLLLLGLGGIGGALWARKNLGGVLEIRRKRRLAALMRKTERRFRQSLAGEGDCQAMLGLVSAEFRAFLGSFTGYNCLAMSAGEFFALPPLVSPKPSGGDGGAGEPLPAAELGGAALGPFFRNLDRLRYGGEKPGAAELSGVLDGLRSFTEGLEKALRGKAAV